MSIKYITLRLNIEKELHRRVWENLRRQRDNRGCSYSDVLLQILIRDIEGKVAIENGIVQSCAERIAERVKEMLQNTLPSYFAGETAHKNIPPTEPAVASSSPEEKVDGEGNNDVIPDEEIPWDYLGE